MHGHSPVGLMATKERYRKVTEVAVAAEMAAAAENVPVTYEGGVEKLGPGTTRRFIAPSATERAVSGVFR